MSVDCGDLIELDGLVIGGTVFFADDAGGRVCKRKTALFVYQRNADDKIFLFLLVQLVDGTGGTDLAAEGTVELAVTETGNKFRGKDTFITTLHEAWLQRILAAYFHTLSATYAFGEKISPRSGSGRTE